MPANATATDFTARIVANEMDERDRYPFMAGIVEGFASARYMADGQQVEGMKCIYDWFYEAESRPHEILTAFERFHDYLPGAVMVAMVDREYGS